MLGIFWMLGLGSLLAVIFGHKALGEIRRSGGWLAGRGLAVAGLVLGYLGLAMLVLGVLVAVSAPSFLGQTSRARQAAAEQNLAVAYRAAKAWSIDQDSFAGFTTAELDAIEPELTGKVTLVGEPTAGSITFADDEGAGANCTQTFLIDAGPEIVSCR